jgi:VPDSG-CTERM motif
MQIKKFRTLAIMSCLAIMLAVGSAKATLVQVDQVIFQNVAGINSSLLTGTVDYTPSGNTATILLRNTSPDAAFTNSSFPAAMLLTGFGFQLGPDITGGTATVNAGSTAVNFVGTDISNQWGYANGPFNGYNLPGVLPINTGLSSIQSVGPLRLDGSSTNINGPNFGAISADETQFGASQEGVRDTIRFVLNLTGPAPTIAQFNAGNIVLAFGSPDTVPDSGSTVALLGFTLIGVEFLRRKIGRNSLRIS